ncbi:MAG: thiosulfate oxidation carrier complex protein SoxZ [Gemmatimonadetes bacterium]|nr:thiosulfate oxidation carrier complex protein SoxZ [Gemmatimonadota bacterium]
MATRTSRARASALRPAVDLPDEIGRARIVLPEKIARDSIVYVRTLVSHPMHTGLFNTPEGAPIAAHWIEDVVVTYGDEEVARFAWTSGISRDPFVTFPLKATREAPLRITWKDNLGATYRQTANLRFS